MNEEKNAKQIDISVVVCAYNEEKLLNQCIESLVNQSFPKNMYEILIVDDESSDKTSIIARQWAEKLKEGLPELTYIRIAHGGLSVARNTGIKHAQGEIIAFIDGDAVATSNWLIELAGEFASSDDPKIIGGPILLLNENSKFASLLYNSIFSHYMEDKHSIIGANMAFSRSLLKGNATFHPAFVRRGDETYIFDKLKTRAVPVQITGAAIYHESPESLKKWLKTRYDNGYFSVLLGIVNINDVDTKKKLFLKIFNSIFFLITTIIIIFLPLMMKSSAMLYFGIFSYFVLAFRRYLLTGYLKDLIKHFWARKAFNWLEKLFYSPVIVLLVLIGYYYADFGSIFSFWKHHKYQRL